MVEDLLAANLLLLVILLVFFAIRRRHRMDIFTENSQMQNMNSKPPVLHAVSVNNPFSIELGRQESENDYLVAEVTTKRTCSIRSYWNVNLAKAVELFHAEEQVGDGAKLTDVLIKFSTLQEQEKIINPTTEEPYSHIIHTTNIEKILEDRAVSPATLSTLAVSVELQASSYREAILNEDIMCLCTIFNLETNRRNNRKIWKTCYQVIQTADRRLFTLKNLYASGVPDLDDAAAETASFASNNRPDLCIICHSNHVTRALLPCRHQCICGPCFKRTNLCPVCRKPIVSYLVTFDESHLLIPIPNEEELAEQTREDLSNMGLVELIKAIWNAS